MREVAKEYKNNIFPPYSVLMSVYEKEKPEYLSESIISMLNQTYQAEQIVIVCDGPVNDRLNRVIDKYKEKYDELITVIRLQRNLGLGQALNIGLEHCRNELVARMDTDDISLSDRCEKQVAEFVLDSSLCIIGSHIDEFSIAPEQTKTSRVVPITHEAILKYSRRRSPFNHPTVMYKKSVVLELGGYGKSVRKEDIELFVRMLHSGCKSKNIDESLLLYRSNDDNLRRRKSWINCRDYIAVVFEFYQKGYSNVFDLLYVTLGQMVMFLTPFWLTEILNYTFLRKRI